MNNDDFARGYVCAVSCIVSGWGIGTETEEALNCLGKIDWSIIDKHDIKVLRDAGFNFDEAAKEIEK